jgi:transposase InsO family protein
VITSSGSNKTFPDTAIGAWADSCAVKGSWSTTRTSAGCRENTSYFPSAGVASRLPPPIRINHKVYPNLLAEKIVTGINQAWVADITYIRILKGFVFLAAMLDRYSRKVIGWAISQRLDAELCVAALSIALEQRQPPPGCIHHSDRGVQYACAEYITLLEQAQMQISMSRTAQSLRQCPHGIVLQNPKVRGGAPG